MPGDRPASRDNGRTRPDKTKWSCHSYRKRLAGGQDSLWMGDGYPGWPSLDLAWNDFSREKRHI